MTNEEIHAFLRRLATDDQFRQHVERDPIGALAPYGITVDPQHAPPNVVVKLPPGQRILDKLDALADELPGLLCAVPLCHLLWQPGHV
jgi:putative modified peptide